MQGWVKLHRETQLNAVWTSTTPEQKVIFLTLLMMVNHAANQWEWEGDKYSVQPGQTVTSVDSIVKAGGKGITPQKVKTAIKKFEKYGILTSKATKRGRLITLLNWGKYQLEDRKLTNESTVDQPTGNQQLTTNKNDKNVTMIEEVSSYSQLDDKEPNPDLKDIVSLYYQLYEQYTGSKPLNQWAKDCSILKKSGITEQDADQVKGKLDTWFKVADPYTKNSGYPLALFASQYNRIVELPKDELKTCIGICDKCQEVLWKEVDHKCKRGYCKECNEPLYVGEKHTCKHKREVYL